MGEVITTRAAHNYYSAENRRRRRRLREIKRSIRRYILFTIISMFCMSTCYAQVSVTASNLMTSEPSIMDSKIISNFETLYVLTEELISENHELYASIVTSDSSDILSSKEKMKLTRENYILAEKEAAMMAETEAMMMQVNPEVIEIGVDNSETTSVTITNDTAIESSDTVVIETTVSNNSNGYFGWTEEDYNYLVMVLTGECQCSDFDTQIKVGSVVLNRINNPNYFSYAVDIKSTVTAKNQYACFNDGNAYRTPTETTKAAAMWLLENGSVYPVEVVYQAQFIQGDGVYEKVGNEYFCYQY